MTESDDALVLKALRKRLADTPENDNYLDEWERGYYACAREVLRLIQKEADRD